jgi:hypothetical protein
MMLVLGDHRMLSFEIESKRSWLLWISALSVFGALVLAVPTLHAAQPSPEPKIVEADAVNWWSVDAGGGETSGGNWHMISTLGQHDASALSGSSITLDGGFVLPGGPAETPLFADGFESGHLGAWSSVTP